jgi:tetratricopeptide (TPR) repeat protein
MGMVYSALDKYELAMSEFKKAIEFYPEYALAHYQLGLVSLKLKLNEQATASFREVARLAPDSEVGQLSREQLDKLK